MSVLTTKFGDGDAISGPRRWGAATVPSRINAVRHAIGTAWGVFLDWYVLPSASMIPPGGELAGFRVTSRLKPGVTVAYVRGGDEPALRGDMPRAVLEQTVPLMQIEFNSQNVVTIGPRFDGATPQEEIVAHFHKGLGRLVDTGQASPDSPALRQALAVLRRCL